MKLCSRLFVLYYRNCPKYGKFRYFIPHFEEVRGGVEPWLMAHWKARIEFLLGVSELLFYLLRLRHYKAKRACQYSLLSGGGRSVRAKISGGRGRPWGIFCGFYKSRRAVVQRVRHFGLRSVGRGFKSCSKQRCVTTLGKLFTPSDVCASVTKQYNLVPAKGR